jgi:hypothetical protein
MNIYFLSTLLIGCHSFRPHATRSYFRGNVNVFASTLPTVTELSSDPFMKQISHSEALVSLLLENDANVELPSLLKAQLSHSDGIRGFFATYLTHERSPNNVVPTVLQRAMESSENHMDLVDLSFMNLIMPTAMVTMHHDPELSNQSRITAERGLLILQALKEMPLTQELVIKEYEAILAALTGEAHANSSKLEFWMQFFERWGYGDKQRTDITEALRRLR